MTESQFVLVLHLIGLGGTRFNRSEHSKAKPMQSQITFDTQLKTALTKVSKEVLLIGTFFT